jgi:hypothetical protein
MSNKKDTDNIVLASISAFLLDKQIWVWWLFYLAVTAVIFGISSLALYLLGIQPWIGVLVLVAAGLAWGSVNYFRIRGKVGAINKKAAKTEKAEKTTKTASAAKA